MNAFMNKFKKLGFIEYNSGGLTIKDALLTTILRDERHENTNSQASRRGPTYYRKCRAPAMTATAGTRGTSCERN